MQIQWNVYVWWHQRREAQTAGGEAGDDNPINSLP